MAAKQKKKPAYCQMADGVADGLLASSKTEEEWRALCPGSMLGTAGEVLSACDACPRYGEVPRDPADRCEVCWDWNPDVIKALLLGRPRCVDFDGCHTRYSVQAAENEVFDSEREQRLESVEVVGETKAELPAAEGRSEWSGKKTRGARFLPGEDLALKTALVEHAEAGNLECAVELAVRGWFDGSEGLETVRERAERIAVKDGASGWMRRRLRARWEWVSKRLPVEESLDRPTPKTEQTGEVNWTALDTWKPKQRRSK